MKTVYKSKILSIGNEVREGLSEGLMILFANASASDDMKDYCVVHEHLMSSPSFEVGDYFVLGNKRFTISAVGNSVIENFQALGHMTVVFDGAEEALLPGNIHILGNLPKEDVCVGGYIALELFN